METSLKTGFAQVFSCCPKNLSCPKFGGAAAPLAPPARTPMRVGVHKGHAKENVTKRRPQTPEKRRLFMADFFLIHSDSQANRVKVTEALFCFTGYNFLPT